MPPTFHIEDAKKIWDVLYSMDMDPAEIDRGGVVVIIELVYDTSGNAGNLEVFVVLKSSGKGSGDGLACRSMSNRTGEDAGFEEFEE
ncbi:MAG: hypothetical protein NZL93_06235, partial [Chthoniobacterales bacterium]|nr:hypothetical protein [Chthoniobacterales bacterium]